MADRTNMLIHFHCVSALGSNNTRNGRVRISNEILRAHKQAAAI